MMNSKQEQVTQKQMLLNEYVDKLMQLSHVTKYQKNQNSIAAQNTNTKRIDVNLMQMFDLLIWIQKRKPQLLSAVLQMDLLSLIINLIPYQQISKQIKAFILLINNCKINGEIIVNLLANRLIDLVIIKYLKSLNTKNESKVNKLFGKQQNSNNMDLQQKLEYLGSLLKACNVHLNQKTYPYFFNKKIDFSDHSESKSQISKNHKNQPLCDMNDIFNTCDVSLQKYHNQSQQKQCLLIKICTRFYNCHQQITKTAVMNILMNILRQPFAKQLVFQKQSQKPYPYILQWSRNLCCQFRNQLKNLNQQLMVLKPSQQDFFLQQLNDKIMLWQDLTQQIQFKIIFKDNFMNNVIYSLIVGSLNTSSLPMFNIKFTFFILAKMMKICSNLGILNQIGQLLFVKKQIKYSQNWVSTAVLSSFDLGKVLDDQYWNNNNNDNQEMNTFDGVNQFFINMVRSKDQHFLQISSNMLQQLMLYVRKDQSSLNFFKDKLGFCQNGMSLLTLSSILIGQLKFDHSLNNLKRICETLTFIQPNKHLSQDSINEFLFFYSEYLNQTLSILQKGSKILEYVVQTFQYDMRILQHMKFICTHLKDKYLLMHPNQRMLKMEQQYNQHQKQNKGQDEFRKSFYNLIPQTPSQIMRYKIIKTFLLLKFKSLIIQTQAKQDILTKYVSRLKAWDQKQLKSGDKLAYPLKQKFYKCYLIQQKTQIPCVIIQDDVNLIIGFAQQKNVKIIVNAKIKHVEASIETKKDKTFIKINLNKFDFQSQNIVYKSTIMLRGFQTGIQYLAVKKQNFKQKQINSIKKGLKKTVQNLPEISLL